MAGGDGKSRFVKGFEVVGWGTKVKDLRNEVVILEALGRNDQLVNG